MSRRRGEFEHRTSLFEGASRAWSHLGGLEPHALENKSASDLDPLTNPLFENDSRVKKKEKGTDKNNNKDTTKNDSGGGCCGGGGRGDTDNNSISDPQDDGYSSDNNNINNDSNAGEHDEFSGNDNLEIGAVTSTAPTSLSGRHEYPCLQSSKIFLKSFWMKKDDDKGNKTLVLIAAIICWYLLGIVSIISSKILLGGASGNWNVAPMVLTCQQFGIGSSLLSQYSSKIKSDHYLLKMTGSCFSIGFWLTNVSFFASHASFVETIKAAEPISSATIAVLWGIESNISFGEMISLFGITCGVVLSTIGSVSDLKNGDSSSTGLRQSAQVCAIVLLSNFCFSFRSMYQKLYLKNQKQQQYSENTQVVSDADLQYSMQSLGLKMFIIPTIVWNGHGTLQYLFHWFMNNMHNSDTSTLLISNLCQDSLQYIALALINGLAFTGYK